MSKHDISFTRLDDLTEGKVSNRKVRIYARVLAAGALQANDETSRTRLRLTLLLTPFPVGDAAADDIDLHAWPTGILEALSSDGAGAYTVPLLIQPFTPTANTALRPLLDDFREHKNGVELVRARATNLWSAYGETEPGDEVRTALNRLWRQTFLRAKDKDGKANPNPERAWDALFAGLKATFEGASFAAGKIDGDDKQTETSINDVRSVRQGDLAITLELLRAHETAATVREVLGEAQARRTLERELQAVSGIPSGDEANPTPLTSDDEPVNKEPKAFAADIEKTKKDERTATKGRLGRGDGTGTTAKKAFDSTRGTVAGTGGVKPPAIGYSTELKPHDLANATAAQLHAAMDAPLASHADGTWVQQRTAPKPETSDGAAAVAPVVATIPSGLTQADLDHANQRFFAVQSAPSLARLFGMAIDLEIELEQLPGEGSERFFFLATDFGGVGTATSSNKDHPFAVTLGKFHHDGQQRPLFWPATRAEIDARAFNAVAAEADKIKVEDYLTQENGVMVVGHGWAEKPEDRDPRFEITSLDVRAVAETQEQRNRERRNLPPEEANKDGDPHYEALRDRPIERQTMQTAGLTVLDRAREHTAAAKLAVRTAQGEVRNSQTAPVILLDGDELTVGYRPDVGVWVANVDGAPGIGKYEWRGLMNREVVFGASGERDDMDLVKALLTTLTGEVGDEARTMLDSASLSTPMRLMPEVPGASGEPGIATIVEEIVTTWDGGPMGIDCSGPDSIKTVTEDLPIGRDISLPSRVGSNGDDKELLPPQLRFGWPYRVGFRAVYMGGVSLSVAEASVSYATGAGYLAFPPTSSEAGSRAEKRRFLRHERIDAPILLLPGDIARRGDRLMGFERSPEAVVRTYEPPAAEQVKRLATDARLLKDFQQAEDDAQARATPSTTRRIFVAPKVGQAFAAYHGVFDEEEQKGQPTQGLSGVRYDGPMGSFPYAVPKERRGLDGIVFPLSREVKASKDDHGDAVFETTNEPSSSRAAPYYPDPMAHFFVLGLRHPVTKQLIAGAPVVVELYAGVTAGSGSPQYPGALPMQVEVRALNAKRPRGYTVTHNDIITVDPDTVRLKTGGTGKPVPGRSVTLNLAAGEDFELVVWCLPNIPALARTMALVETLGILAKRESAAEVVNATGLLKLFAPSTAAGVEQKFPESVDGAVSTFDFGAAGVAGFVGIGGLETPGPRGLLAVATVLHHAMRLAPVDEIAATTSLRVTHAASRPLLPPELVVKPVNDTTRSIAIARLGKANAEALRVMAPQDRYAKYFEHPLVEASSGDFALGGTVLIDLDTSNGFEIEAVTTYPRSPKLDDMQKRRTRADRQAGVWPTVINLGDGTRRLSSTADIYGFQVDADGRVELPRSAVTLLRVENIADPQVGPSVGHQGEHEIIDLETVYGLEFAAKGFYGSGRSDEKAAAATATDEVSGQPVPDYFKHAKVALPHAFADGKARRLTLSVIAHNRSGPDWLTAARRDENQIFQYGEPLAVTAQSRRSAPVDVWLPATFRPGKPITRTPLPAFKWVTEGPAPKAGVANCQVYKTTRESIVRVWLQREWFSSGENEKLGVVLWPPNLFDRGSEIIADDWIVFPEPSGAAATGKDGMRHARLPDFTDLDLGPGGVYVTRWGGDPIRGGSRQTSMFMPPTAFADYCDPDEPNPPSLVRSVSMPIGSGESGNGRVSLADLDSLAEDEQAKTASETLTVSLLTYEPRFDVGSEEWYVDLRIDPASATDPFVRLGLVRYQAHAPAHLRVSQPVVEWTQLLPRRTATIEVTDEAGDLAVEATVLGQAAESVAEDHYTSAESKLRYDRPVMTFSLMFEGTDRDGRRTQQLVELLSTDADLHEDAKLGSASSRSRTKVQSFEGQTKWTAWFAPISAAKRARLGEGRYFVTVEEVEYRHPASYPGREPLTLAASDKTYVASGPRFFTRIDLTSVAGAGAKEREQSSAS